MKETLAQRINHHVGLANMAGSMALESGLEHANTWRLAEAVHELGITIATAAQGARVDESEIEQLGQDVSAIATAAQAHREAIDKVMKGLAPWGEVRDSIDRLEKAVSKVVMR